MGDLQRAWRIKEQEFYRQKTLREKISFLLRYAILAPSTHNSQPWRFKINGNSCEFFIDRSAVLPQADPLRRDMYISIGCCLENFIIAARYFGLFKDVAYRGEGGDRVAEVFLHPDSQEKDSSAGDLLLAITKRRNSRGIFLDQKIPTGFLEMLSGIRYDEYTCPLFVSDEAQKGRLADFTKDALKTAYKNKDFRNEMSHWVRPNLFSGRDGIPGYALRLPLMASFLFPFLVRFKDIGNRLGELNARSIRSAHVACVIGTKENTHYSWLITGRLAERFMLECTAKGMVTSIFVAAIEIWGFTNNIRELIGTDFSPQFLFCMGYMANPSRPTPRYSVEQKCI